MGLLTDYGSFCSITKGNGNRYEGTEREKRHIQLKWKRKNAIDRQNRQIYFDPCNSLSCYFHISYRIAPSRNLQKNPYY